MWDLRAGIREFCEKKASQGSQMSNGREILLLMRLYIHISMSETEPDFNTLVQTQNQIFPTEWTEKLKIKQLNHKPNSNSIFFVS